MSDTREICHLPPLDVSESETPRKKKEKKQRETNSVQIDFIFAFLLLYVFQRKSPDYCLAFSKNVFQFGGQRGRFPLGGVVRTGLKVPCNNHARTELKKNTTTATTGGSPLVLQIPLKWMEVRVEIGRR